MNDRKLLDRVTRVREFNRLYTGVIGVLDEGLVGTEYSLSEARVLYELEQQGVTEVTELRRRLAMDAGYASRLLGKLEGRGLLTRERSDTDARRQLVRLTEAGRAAQHSLEERTIEQIGELLGRFTDEDQHRLLSSMAAITTVVGERARDSAVVLRPPRPGDFGWVVQRNGALYAQEYGWDATYEALVARIVADYVDKHDPKREAAWIAEVDGERAGCVFCVRGSDEHTAKLRLLIVEPSARGHGLGKRLVAECVAFAKAHGYQGMELWTNSVLVAARAIYAKTGFELVASEPHHSFGHDLVGETWRLEW
ncbi:bifunctional helix-turn-helix transcriptional regulator/GNAT family N-acetyltransferase [Amycolatopsis acidiphila]|uniref:Bifunctional helix-turn-helix transcriptional regulator/GNAT family N-acetyltransferase n=1 Tax=Amycolatopsis acidiphila TaxID=715473 RepID=A0A558A6Q5_9PSEU|nr:bifunctional helix-turn-helix transcriptional regulator/GNAT family N-acetyltransferase [Amycolatopsis acidiphila]TVT19953.1 bifunctional helix-turn-helix transcriptional regulator/GNAT family N-acetyltransferase [Amycolatopsis acidiphila]UIJ60055.1 bifunctional helix-turn-helix transcriptional regulator/GNAT family N-acetyltransferase [Amycolatopsis acidiphila]GHG61607.1 MarR family transcriptional regulator [Amycolatopsis acidiphila]